MLLLAAFGDVFQARAKDSDIIRKGKKKIQHSKKINIGFMQNVRKKEKVTFKQDYKFADI